MNKVTFLNISVETLVNLPQLEYNSIEMNLPCIASSVSVFTFETNFSPTVFYQKIRIKIFLIK